MKLTEKHIAFARVCARLEIAGQGSKVMAEECGVSRQTMYNWLKSAAFLAEKARCVAVFQVDLSDISLTHRRARIEALVKIAEAPETSDIAKLRAIQQISDEAAADVEGMIVDLSRQIDIFKRQIAGEKPEGKSPPTR